MPLEKAFGPRIEMAHTHTHTKPTDRHRPALRNPSRNLFLIETIKRINFVDANATLVKRATRALLTGVRIICIRQLAFAAHISANKRALILLLAAFAANNGVASSLECKRPIAAETSVIATIAINQLLLRKSDASAAGDYVERLDDRRH